MNKTEQVPLPEAFAALGIRNSVLRGLAAAKFQTPSEIQSLLIPRALAGVDLLGQARTGTGKTAAFGVPILCQAAKGTPTQALILVPTRELAVQVEAEIKRLAQFTGLRSVAVYGGQRITAQMKFLRHNPEIVVGTPGRVIDLLERRILNLQNIRFVVLDEVDRMLDIGFRDDIRNILSRIESVRAKVRRAEARDERRDEDQNGNLSTAEAGADATADPAITDDADQAEESRPNAHKHQTMFVSATISDEIDRLARRYMTEPVEKLIAPGADDKPTVEKVEQWYFSVQPWDKYRLLRTLILQENPDLAIVFCRTKQGAQKLAKKLHADGIECREIHGNLDQGKRERVMKSFRSGKFDVLVATDLASRGIDVADISHIINYDLPDDPEAYVHRVGRTARMGAAGKAFSFVQRDQGDALNKVEALINMIIQPATIEGFEATPPPRDWIERGPAGSAASTAAAPTGDDVPATPLPRRTLGSKTPITRRHRRRRR